MQELIKTTEVSINARIVGKQKGACLESMPSCIAITDPKSTRCYGPATLALSLGCMDDPARVDWVKQDTRQ